MAMRDFASLLTGGLGGAQAGGGLAAGMKMAGMAQAGPWAPWLMGGGALLGAAGSFLGQKADQEALEDDPEYKAAKRREKGLSMFRNNVGRALRTSGPQTFGGMLNGSP
jgi:hypothetical protein